ncbi:MAG TPA: META domain-containing protein [Candidatus Humimicrobiaceae bacterium]
MRSLRKNAGEKVCLFSLTIIAILFILLGILSVIACRYNEDDIAPIKLDGTQWKLISLNGSELIEGTHISLYFRNGIVWGSAGCNIYGGEYLTEDPDILNIPGVGKTEMDCLSPEGIMEQDDTYTRSLTNAAFYYVTGEHLEIYSADKQKLLIFERKPEYPMNPADLVGTSWQLISINGDQVTEGLSIMLTFDSDSEASGCAGCFDYELSYEASGDDIRWGIRSERNGELPQDLEFQALRYTDSILWASNYRLTTDGLEIYTAKGDILVYKSS